MEIEKITEALIQIQIEACVFRVDPPMTIEEYDEKFSRIENKLDEIIPLSERLESVLPKVREALDPMILDVIANEIENSANSFIHSARIHTLRLLANKQRRALQSLDGKEESK